MAEAIDKFLETSQNYRNFMKIAFQAPLRLVGSMALDVDIMGRSCRLFRSVNENLRKSPLMKY